MDALHTATLALLATCALLIGATSGARLLASLADPDRPGFGHDAQAEREALFLARNVRTRDDLQ